MKNILKYLYYKIKGTLYPDLYIDDEFLLYVLKKREGLIRNLSEIETLALGSSVADYSFYAPLWKNSYNLGLTSADLFLCYSLYNSFSSKMNRLKDVIVFFSVANTGYSLIRTNEKYRYVSYKFFFDVPYIEDKWINSFYEKIIVNRCEKISRKDLKLNAEYRGYNKDKRYWNNGDIIKHTSKHFRENQREPNQLQWLFRLSEMVQKDNRKLYVVIPPYRSDYRQNLPSKEVLFNKLMCQKQDIEIVDLYNHEKFSDEVMGDPNHLNHNGAIKLTKYIKSILFK